MWLVGFPLWFKGLRDSRGNV
ncbi:hypothetical protein CBM2592_A260001 [Cupriavidus taiwanensis]|nr:hypothetical protein CBM2592_A260001 [Cupriavidus taiwanensis]SOY51762.1 hypothetical protein CBM2588_A210001 [Cupriavidus taiwanensis]SOY84283.1 hypothetical protein CBM2591_A300001 [Cupriavidus taiwanensis]SOZ58914.1 hypothetical protein CBM2617_A300001 [Cupriavidus taiwanensis]SOZ79998.1 hypothetical protein CBM2618_A270001 [Cupriavidus taiwanensis]